jgi:hypothetical protein
MCGLILLFRFYAMRHSIVWQIVTKVSEEHTASICRVNPEDGGSGFLVTQKI